MAARVNDEIFSTGYFDLMDKLYRRFKSNPRYFRMQQLGNLIGWHIVARRAEEEGFSLSTEENYRLAQKRHALLKKYLDFIRPLRSSNFALSPITNNLALLSLEDRQAFARGEKCPNFEAKVNGWRISATETVKHIPPKDKGLLVETDMAFSSRACMLLENALKKAAEEKEALAAAEMDLPALTEILRRLEERTVFIAYMQERRLGPIGAAMPLRSKDLNEVNDDEVHAYYDSHRERFRRLIRVTAQRIMVQNEGLAQELLMRLQKGEDFTSLTRESLFFSQPAEWKCLGTLERGKPGPVDPWTQYLIFRHLQRHPDSGLFGPLRVGSQGDWQIFDLRHAEFEDVQLECMRAQICRRLAREKIRWGGMKLLLKLLTSATITVNRKLIGEPKNDGKELS